MAVDQNAVNDDSIGQVQTQMHSADEECVAAWNAVDSTYNYIVGHWQGDASLAFRNAIEAWLNGLNDVRDGLHRLADAMQNHQLTSTQIEEDNRSLGATWALN